MITNGITEYTMAAFADFSVYYWPTVWRSYLACRFTAQGASNTGGSQIRHRHDRVIGITQCSSAAFSDLKKKSKKQKTFSDSSVYYWPTVRWSEAAWTGSFNTQWASLIHHGITKGISPRDFTMTTYGFTKVTSSWWRTGITGVPHNIWWLHRELALPPKRLLILPRC